MTEIILDEEQAFGRTLNKGIEKFNKVADELVKEGKTVVPGAVAFFLYDSMGFPFDLTEVLLLPLIPLLLLLYLLPLLLFSY